MGKGDPYRVQAPSYQVFRSAVRLKANAALVIRNRPNGDPTPSPEDLAVLDNLLQAATFLGIRLLDSVIFSPTCWYSRAVDVRDPDLFSLVLTDEVTSPYLEMPLGEDEATLYPREEEQAATAKGEEASLPAAEAVGRRLQTSQGLVGVGKAWYNVAADRGIPIWGCVPSPWAPHVVGCCGGVDHEALAASRAASAGSRSGAQRSGRLALLLPDTAGAGVVWQPGGGGGGVGGGAGGAGRPSRPAGSSARGTLGRPGEALAVDRLPIAHV
ncbi:MAG: hypothetical protein GX605_03475 [Chloroflexi bacterium]|nr:hypothetical protein [Chloroflexota bacterium]